MDRLTVPLTADQRRFVDEQVRRGEFASPEAVVQSALESERLYAEVYAAKARALREAAQVGIDQIERGEGIRVADVDAFFDGIWAEAEADVGSRRAHTRRRA